MHRYLHKCAILCIILYHAIAFLLLELRIADTGMVDGLQLLDEHGLGVLDVAVGDGAFAEISLADLCVDDAVDKVANSLLGVLGQRARGGFDGIGHHQDSLFLREGIRTGVSEQQVIDFLLGELVFLLDIEELCLAKAVVSGNELADDVGQVVLLGELQSLGDMADGGSCRPGFQ